MSAKFKFDFLPGNTNDPAPALAHLYSGQEEILSVFARLGAFDREFESAVADAAIAQELSAQNLAELWRKAQKSADPFYAFGFPVLGGLFNIAPLIAPPGQTAFDRAPSLKTIWPKDFDPIARYRSAERISRDNVKGGEIDLILAGRVIVGLTGWHPIDGSSAGLRWHGIVPPAQRFGFSRHALDLLCESLPPEYEHLYALTSSSMSCAVFRRSGFDAVVDTALIRTLSQAAKYDVAAAGGWALRRTVKKPRA